MREGGREGESSSLKEYPDALMVTSLTGVMESCFERVVTT